MVKNPLANGEDAKDRRVGSLGGEDPLEEEMATCSRDSQRVGHH